MSNEKHLLIKDGNGNYLNDESGNFINEIDLKDEYMGGSTTPTVKLIVENNQGVDLKNIVVVGGEYDRGYEGGRKVTSVYSFGMGDSGRLGHGGVSNQHTPKQMETFVGRKVFEAKAGGGHTFVRLSNGNVYSCGAGYAGVLGLGHSTNRTSPDNVETLNGVGVTSMFTGYRHTFALTDKGEAYSFGEGSYGKLGHGNSSNYSTPRLIKALEGKRIVQAAAGYEHSLVLTDKGEVYSFGNGDYGRLGHGDTSNHNTPKLIEALEDKKVVDVSAGSYHSLVLTDKGEVYSFGAGGAGRLGHGNTSHYYTPIHVESLTGEKIVKVSAGSTHSLVLTGEGEVFSFGGGGYGQHGHGCEDNFHFPKRIEALVGKKIVNISAGNNHSLVLTDKGEVYSFGNGGYGRLGHGDTSDIHTPMKIEEFEGAFVSEISAGGSHSIVITTRGGYVESGNVLENTDIEFSTSLEPFIPQDSITIPKIEKDGEAEFYLRFKLDKEARAGGYFGVIVNAEPDIE